MVDVKTQTQAGFITKEGKTNGINYGKEQIIN